MKRCALRTSVVTLVLLLTLVHIRGQSSKNNTCPLQLDGQCIVNLHGRSGNGYYTEILVGSPPQKLNALIDTGSSNVAIAAAPEPQISKFFNRSRSSTLRELHVSVDVPYSQGSWRGELASDVVRLPETGAPTVRCDVALIQTSQNFYINRAGWQGIVGLAYKQIALPNSSVTTWVEGAQHVKLGQLTSVSVVLCGPDHSGAHHGYIEFGETRDELVRGPLFSAAIFRPWFYEVLLTNITIGGQRLSMPCLELNADKTIVDTGTTNLRLPEKVFAETVSIMKAQAGALVDGGHAFWTGKDQVCFGAVNRTVPWSFFPNITLALQTDARTAFELTLTSQSYLREALDTAPDGQRCFKLGIDSSVTGTVLGVVVLEGLYVRFNLHEQTVDFAMSTCGPEMQLTGPHHTDDSSGCGYVPRSAYSRTLHIAMYIVGGMLAVICIPLMAVAVSCLRTSRRWRHSDQSSLRLLMEHRDEEHVTSSELT